MKGFALLLALLCIGDLAVDHGATLRAIGHAAEQFAHATVSAFHDSVFAA